MPLPLKLAHRRYTQQAGWTTNLRRHLFAQAGLANASRILEVGCGTGAVLRSINHPPRTTVFGLDIDLASLLLARTPAAAAHLSGGDAHFLPYNNSTFDISFCHFVLLWLADPLAALREMRRVTRPGGAVLAFAEPDYGGRIDHPGSLATIGKEQTGALRAQGADPELGRKLPGLFHAAGISQIESGVLGAEWVEKPNPDDQSLEQEVLLADLEGRVAKAHLERYSKENQRAWEEGQRVLYVPTFYAWGRV